MNRPYIICHMMASVDGRIDCDMTEKIETGNEYYEALEELDAPTTAFGKVTAVLHYALPERFAAANSAPVGEERVWKAMEEKAYTLVFETIGTMQWEDNRVDDCPLVCVLGEGTSLEYLDYLQAKGISYIVAGADGIDLPRAMALLRELFGVERLALVGGGRINGAFLAAGLIDEVSVMIAPGIDGRAGQPCVFDGLPADAEPVQLELQSFKTYECGTVWMRYKPKNNGERL